MLIAITAGMAYLGTRLQLSYQIARILPLSDSTQQQYEQFKERFGVDGTLMVIGWQDQRWFDLPVYQKWYDMTSQIKAIPGIKEVLSTARLYTVERQDTLWSVKPLVTARPSTQAAVDSIRQAVERLPFYEGLLLNSQNRSTLMAITFDESRLNSRERIAMVQHIREHGEAFEKATGIEVHYSGMPSIRTEVMRRVSGEMKLFMFLSALAAGGMVWLLFRNIRVVALSMLVVTMGVCVTVGTLSLFGYEITILTGLLPPLLLVIGIPNCVFLVNFYNAEMARHGQKDLALQNAIRKIGLSSLLANVTTAIGFGVFYFTNSRLLMEFGVVAAVCVMAMYVICLIMVPILLSYLPDASAKKQAASELNRRVKLLGLIDQWVQHRRPVIYISIALITVISAWGLTWIRIEGHVVDDLPQKDPVYADLRFFEQQFKGVLPMEVMIDTKKPNGIVADGARVLYKVRSLERIMAEYPAFAKPRSLVDGLRFAYQAYRGGDPKYYVLPPLLELQKVANSIPAANNVMAGNKTAPANASKPPIGPASLVKSMTDSSRQILRVSYQMADIGSIQLEKILSNLRPRIDSLFAGTDYHVSLTGHSLVFLKSNDYLLGNLYESLAIAIVLIALVGMILFRSIPIILLSKLPCLIPLVVTAGMMGYLDLPFKPSTILVFSIAFGLASDGTVYFLTSYRRHLEDGAEPQTALSGAIFETGNSLIDTALILAGGFAVFAASGFGGTAALGVLVATTVLMACVTNLVLLPALLLTLKRYRV